MILSSRFLATNTSIVRPFGIPPPQLLAVPDFCARNDRYIEFHAKMTRPRPRSAGSSLRPSERAVDRLATSGHSVRPMVDGRFRLPELVKPPNKKYFALQEF